MISRSRGAGYRVAAVGALSVVMLIGQLTLAGPAVAAPYSGGFSPTIIGQLADLNGDGAVSGRDDANAFYGDTHIIDGRLDCNAWVTTNDGAAGDGAIDTADDCTLIGVNGSADGVEIEVVDGEFHWDGPLPFVFNAADPDNPDVSDSDFAWSTLDGRVDANGDEAIDEDDCHLGLVGETVDAGLGDPTDGADTLGNDAGNTNPCGFAIPPDDADDGLVDLNSDGDITAADSCTNGCFFRHNVTSGMVQDEPIAAPSPPLGTYTGGFSPTVIGQLADLNGDGAVSGRDDANAFFGDTHIIDGRLDCNAWITANDGTLGDGAISTADDCTLIGVDGSPDGVTIAVVDGAFQWPDGPLPFVFNASDPDNPDVSDSDFAWSAIDGRVDSNGDEAISVDDCHFGLIGETVDAGLGDPTDGADILGNTAANTNPCGFGTPPDAANNGLVDLNSDGVITAADSCPACFFGLEVLNGFVMAPVAATLDLTPATDTNQEDTPHTVTANVEDLDGDPMAGVTVRFSVTGANPTSGTGTTSFGGNTSFTYTGANPGTDTITAFADSNGNGIQDPGEPSDTATKTWAAAATPPAAASCRGQPATHVGTNGNNTIVGTSGNDVIVAMGGNDTVKSKGGADVVCAGPGKDTVRAGSANDLVLGQGGKDFLLGQGGKDRINGGGGRDRIKGGSGRDTLRGQGANDKVRGQGGADKLNGGPGRDLCNGGAGTDTATACEKEQLIP